MLAEVRLLIAPTEIRLVFKANESVVEDELWKSQRRLTAKEAKQLAEVAFHDFFDLVNYSVNGDGE